MTTQIKSDIQIFDRHNVELPRWRIDKETGQFVHDFGDVVEQLQVAILKVDNSRTLWPERFREGNLALCRSHNTLWPEERDPAKNAYGEERDDLKICFGCPMAEWREDEAGERIKPRCAKQWNFLLLDVTTGILGVLTLSRTRARAAKKLMAFWQMTNYRFPVILTAEKIRGASGEWYGVDFRREPPFDEQFRQQLIDISAQFATWSLSSIARDENGDVEPDEDEGGE